MAASLPERMIRWLFRGPARLPSGAYLSWHAADGSGFVYPEAAAHAALTACWWAARTGDAGPLERCIPTLSFLASCVDREGLVRHDGIGYLFDTALVLSAFRRFMEAGVPGDFRDLVPRMYDGCLRLVERREAATPLPSERWSAVFGPHLLKPLALLIRDATPGSSQVKRLDRTVRSLLAQQRTDGAFPSNGGVYLHAHAYAVEGLAMLAAAPSLTALSPACKAAFLHGLSFLARQQRADGSFPAWADGRNAEQAADVTAQAGRLFLLARTAGTRFSASAARRALARCIAPSAAVLYRPGSAHENVWCTVFAAQWLYGLRHGGLAPDELI